MIQGIYFNNMPDHLRPARSTGPHTNRGVRASSRDTTGRYVAGRETDHFFKAKVLPKIEAARKRGDIVRFINGSWFVNGQPLKV